MTRLPKEYQDTPQPPFPTMTMRTILLLLLVGLLFAPGCDKHVVPPGDTAPMGTQQPGKEEPKSYLKDEAQLKKLIEQAEEKKTRIPSGTYATYGYIQMQKKNYAEAVRNFELEMEAYPDSRPQMEKLIQAAKRRQWLEQEIEDKKTEIAASETQQPQATSKAQSTAPKTPRETTLPAQPVAPAQAAAPGEQAAAPSEAKPSTATPAQPVAPAQAAAPGEQAAKPVYSTLKEVLAFSTENGMVVALHLLGEVGKVEHFALREPLRYVIDVPGRWRVEGPKEIAVNVDKVSRIRVGEYPDKLRVVVDLSAYPDSISDPVKSPDWLSITIR